jgi:hypothetical protein
MWCLTAHTVEGEKEGKGKEYEDEGEQDIDR